MENNQSELFDKACKQHDIPEYLSQREKERLLFAAIFKEYKIPEFWTASEKKEKYSGLQKMIRPSLFRYRKVQDHNINGLKGDYIPVSMPDMMGATGDDFDSQIFIDYAKVQSEFSLHLSLDTDYFAKWAFEGKPFPEDKLEMVSREMRSILENGQRHLRGNIGLKPMLRTAQAYIRGEVSKMTPDSGIEMLDVLQKTGYIACFCEDICLEHMWRNYGTDEKNQVGYALEYDFKSLGLNYHAPKKGNDFMVLPTVYGEIYDATELVIFTLMNNWMKRMLKQRPLKMPDELAWTKGYFYKHEKFRDEVEWRLVTPISGIETQTVIGANQDDRKHSKIYVSPKAIYYGFGISNENFEMLEEIAVKKNLIRYRMVEDTELNALRPVLIEA